MQGSFSCIINSLPNDVLSLIFAHCSFRDVFALTLTCRRFANFLHVSTSANGLWQQWLRDDCGLLVASGEARNVLRSLKKPLSDTDAIDAFLPGQIVVWIATRIWMRHCVLLTRRNQVQTKHVKNVQLHDTAGARRMFGTKKIVIVTFSDASNVHIALDDDAHTKFIEMWNQQRAELCAIDDK